MLQMLKIICMGKNAIYYFAKFELNDHYPKTIKTSAQLILFVIVNLPSS